MKKTGCFKPQLALAFLITCGSTALRAQSDEELLAASVKEEHASLQHLTNSSAQKDRLRAVTGLDSFFMDYDLLWKLMNDTDIEVRTAAIETLRLHICDHTHHKARPLPSRLAREMTIMLEKEVTQKRMDEALQPGHVNALHAALVVSSALTLNFLYQSEFLTGCASDYTCWQERVLQSLVIALVRRGGEIEGALSFAQNELLFAISDPATLMKTLQVVVEGLDDRNVPPSQVHQNLSMLWSHPLLGKGAPLELMLLAQLSPRLQSLKLRILDSPQKDFNKEYAELVINEITAAVLNAREKLTLLPTKEAQK